MELKLHRRQRGFTLVELLVVIAIIGILVALLLPAVQAAREASRRSSCSNNLKQLALGLQNYHDTSNYYPFHYGGNGSFGANSTSKSWMITVLPFIEQKNLFDKVNFGLPTGPLPDLNDPNNAAVAQTVVPTYLCPSDGANQGGRMAGRANVGAVPPVNPSGAWGVNNYKAVAGSNWAWGDHVVTQALPAPAPPTGRWPGSNNGLDQGNGIICRNVGNDRTNWTNLASITDGTSQTFAIGEAIPAWCTHTWWWWFNGTTATCAVPLNYRKIQGDGFLTQQAGDWPRNYSFFSKHPGGGQFALNDGSNRFIADSIDIFTYRSLATINGDEARQVE